MFVKAKPISVSKSQSHDLPVVGNPSYVQYNCVFIPEFYSGGVVKHIYHLNKRALAALCHILALVGRT